MPLFLFYALISLLCPYFFFISLFLFFRYSPAFSIISYFVFHLMLTITQKSLSYPYNIFNCIQLNVLIFLKVNGGSRIQENFRGVFRKLFCFCFSLGLPDGCTLAPLY
ncbi:hypothetical protein EO98_15905 [Methanosarcina sp. 2.H.T.1A.6]|nr:hypothetical protein EO97_11405 [Methanosarcina sp. 2.H.T.1A.15]KKG17644.1 hypothetical protein EO94_12330 [Methanosarcina sp. 2.H.T.1A.3]KKG21884.1 hypothetical protein EO98_15905 [Methanosarcina sp. 2.H.T.1A.6]KKG25420.1 hypothetical protein EO96_00355 [Methanosarcina sp. 2.H.T.1A.8]